MVRPEGGYLERFATTRTGLVESYGYGWYAALIWVPLYSVLSARAAR
jgi:hypothetical protein